MQHLEELRAWRSELYIQPNMYVYSTERVDGLYRISVSTDHRLYTQVRVSPLPNYLLLGAWCDSESWGHAVFPHTSDPLV